MRGQHLAGAQVGSNLAGRANAHEHVGIVQLAVGTAQLAVGIVAAERVAQRKPGVRYVSAMEAVRRLRRVDDEVSGLVCLLLRGVAVRRRGLVI